MKRFKWILLVVFCVIFSVYYFTKNGLRENIEEGKTQFSSELGFINWSHANPYSTLKAFRSFQELNRSSKDSFEFSYTQKLTLPYLGSSSFIVAQRETRRFAPHLSVMEEKVAFLEIFSSASLAFETMQGSFPVVLIPGSSGSSFRPGDLMGDFISYYSSISGMEISDIKESLHVVSKEEALHMSSGVLVKNTHDWHSILRSCDSSHPIVRELEGIISYAKQLKQPLSNEVSSQQLYYVKD